MEVEDVSEEIKAISINLDLISNNVYGEEMRNWVDSLCSQDCGLVACLANNFDWKDSSNLLHSKVLKQLAGFSPEVVAGQMKSCPLFMKKIIEYVEMLEVEKADHNTVSLFLRVFSESKKEIKEEINEKIFENLLNYFEFCEEEASQVLIIQFIIDNLGKYSESFLKNKNSYEISASVIRLLNKSEGDDEVMYIDSVFLILSLNAELFYSNDLQSLSDILLGIFQNFKKTVYVQAFKIFILLFENEEFKKLSINRSEIIESIEMIEDHDDYYRHKQTLLSIIT